MKCADESCAQCLLAKALLPGILLGYGVATGKIPISLPPSVCENWRSLYSKYGLLTNITESPGSALTQENYELITHRGPDADLTRLRKVSPSAYRCQGCGELKVDEYAARIVYGWVCSFQCYDAAVKIHQNS